MWNHYCALAQDLPAMDPDVLVDLLYCFAHMYTPAKAIHTTFLARDTITAAYTVFREALWRAQAMDPPVKIGGCDQDGNRRLGINSWGRVGLRAEGPGGGEGIGFGPGGPAQFQGP